MNRTIHAYTDSPVGRLLLVADATALRQLSFEDGKGVSGPPPGSVAGTNGIIERAARELAEYFAGGRREFTVEVLPAGTEFQRRVWAELRRIPCATTRSYGDIARRLGMPRACRAVGAANGRNPVAIIVPCHRVIGATGALVGYGGGMERKRRLLEIEGLQSAQGRDGDNFRLPP